MQPFTTRQPSAPEPDPAAERRRREAQALRANLARRKEQGRKRDAEQPVEPGPAPAGPD